MPIRSLLAALAILVLASASGAAAPKSKPQAQCPYSHADRDKIVEALTKAQTCAAAVELFKVCAGGASGDTEYGETVMERCEQDFAAKLSPAQKRAYGSEHKRCDLKYVNKQGSMYVSFTAFCHAELAWKYAHRFARPPAKK
jgi:hypothetical protein